MIKYLFMLKKQMENICENKQMLFLLSRCPFNIISSPGNMFTFSSFDLHKRVYAMENDFLFLNLQDLTPLPWLLRKLSIYIDIRRVLYNKQKWPGIWKVGKVSKFCKKPVSVGLTLKVCFLSRFWFPSNSPPSHPSTPFILSPHPYRTKRNRQRSVRCIR